MTTPQTTPTKTIGQQVGDLVDKVTRQIGEIFGRKAEKIGTDIDKELGGYFNKLSDEKKKILKIAAIVIGVSLPVIAIALLFKSFTLLAISTITVLGASAVFGTIAFGQILKTYLPKPIQ